MWTSVDNGCMQFVCETIFFKLNLLLLRLSQSGDISPVTLIHGLVILVPWFLGPVLLLE